MLKQTINNELSANIKQPMVIKNHPNTNNTLTTNLIARSTPNNYTLFLNSTNALSMTPILSKNVPYDPITDFTPLTIAIDLPIYLIIHKSLPINNIQEFITYTKTNPNKLSFNSSKPNTTHHLTNEFLKTQTGIDMIHIPYRDNGPTMTDLLKKQILTLFATLSTTLPHMKTKNIKILNMIKATRSHNQPNIPTINKTIPNYAMPSSWLGFLAPASIPKNLTQRIGNGFVKTLQVPLVHKTLKNSGFEIVAKTRPEFTKILKSSLQRYRKITADARIEAQ